MKVARTALAVALNIPGIALPASVRSTLAKELLDKLDDMGWVLVPTGFKRKTRSRKGSHRKSPNRWPAHLRWVRTHPCSVPGCEHPSQAAHVRMGTGGGMGLKPGDQFTCPLCPSHHREQHQIGHRAFNEKYDVDLLAIAQELAVASPYIKQELLCSV